MPKSVDMTMTWSQRLLERKGTVDDECLYFIGQEMIAQKMILTYNLKLRQKGYCQW